MDFTIMGVKRSFDISEELYQRLIAATPEELQQYERTLAQSLEKAMGAWTDKQLMEGNSGRT